MYNYLKHNIHQVTWQSLMIIGLIAGVSQAYAGDTAVKVQIDNIDARVSTIENQNLDGRIGTIEGQNLDGRIGTIEGQNLDGRIGTIEGQNLNGRIGTIEGQNLDGRLDFLEDQNLPTRLNTIEGNLNSYLIPSIIDLNTDVDSINLQIIEHDGRLNNHEGALGIVEEWLEGHDGRLDELQYYIDAITLHLLAPAPGANLVAVDLTSEDLVGADLRGANMVESILTGVDMTYANLRGTNLAAANLNDTVLSGAILNYANLSGAFLQAAYLGDAQLIHANLSGSWMEGADLGNAKLRGADTDYADLSTATWNNTICPDGTNSNNSFGSNCLDNLMGSIFDVGPP
jgi:uncharacterized protein YjbI with pentapeptide repeats